MLNDYLRVLPSLPEPLIPQHKLRDIEMLCARLPGAWDDFGFECRLSADPQIDFCANVRPNLRGREILAGIDSTFSLPGVDWEDPVWRRIRSFAQEWASPNSTLYHGVSDIWLEFDLPEHAVGIPSPSIFVGFSPEADRDTIVLGLTQLKGDELRDTIRNELEYCIKHLLEDVKIRYAATMLSRKTNAIRLVTSAIQSEAIVPYLRSIGWAGWDNAAFKRMITDIGTASPGIRLAFDVAETIGSRIGFECFFDWPINRNALHALIRYLIDMGLCTSSKGEALMLYPGHQSQLSDPDRWPSQLVSAASLSGQLSVLMRHLSHIKISVGEDLSLEAKAYLEIRHLWINHEQKTVS